MQNPSLNKKWINCDLGECLTHSPDAQIMPLIDMANIACGGHAGDDESMVKTLQLAQKNNVEIGAHPSYKDKANFGRVSHSLSFVALFNLVFEQIAHFQNLCHENKAALTYVKPHGALYHDMMKNPSVLAAICQAMHTLDPNLKLVVQAGIQNFNFDGQHLSKGNPATAKVGFLYEVFADRAYNGVEMRPRSEQGAVLNQADAIIKQYQRFLNQHSFKIDTLCFHGDNPASVEALKQLKQHPSFCSK